MRGNARRTLVWPCLSIALWCGCGASQPPPTSEPHVAAAKPQGAPVSAPDDDAVPQPEEVCSHVIDLIVREFSPQGVEKEKYDAMVDDCVQKANEEIAKDPAPWRCEARCAMRATETNDLTSCDERCGTKKKKRKPRD